MGDAGHPPDEATGASDDASLDFGLIHELLDANDSLENPGCSIFSEPGALSPPFGSFGLSEMSPLVEDENMSSVLELLDKNPQGVPERFELSSDTSIKIQIEEAGHFQGNLSMEDGVHTHQSAISSKGLVIESMVDENIVSSIKERLTYALMYFKESHREGGVLVQVWLPMKRRGTYVLSTCGHPFWLDHHFQRLVNYRSVSTKFVFSALKDSKDALGLPGRVFVGKVPEWTPDVRFFSSEEYPRVNHAQHHDVRGSVAVPIFEGGSSLCLGVLEVVMISEKLNYDLDLENICNALQAVDLRSSVVTSIPQIQLENIVYHRALSEISEVLNLVCHKYMLPLAQTWMPCIQQGKGGSRHSDENYQCCVSTIDSACYIHDTSVWGFHKACSEHHLIVGEGLVGHAFTTNQPCFSPDITSLSKTRYPLAHHARIFNLRGAVAIRLRSIQSGATDFVLEFFLPLDCIDLEMQMLLLNSLSTTIREACRTLRVVTESQLADEKTFHDSNITLQELDTLEVLVEGQRLDHEMLAMEAAQTPAYHCQRSFSLCTEYIEDQPSERALSAPSKQFSFDECDMQMSGVALHGDTIKKLSMESVSSDFISKQKELAKIINFSANLSLEPGSNKEKKISKKKRGKAEKVIGLQVLQQHFAGSLKDAAKSLGVCPTTLKRICRAHGIMRWPSRKIKKVGNSLQKLQKVIDSVEGVGGPSKLNSLYSKLSKVSSSDLIVQPMNVNGELSSVIPCDPFKSSGGDILESIHSEGSDRSSSYSHSCSSSRYSSSSSKGQLEDIKIINNSNVVMDGALNLKSTPGKDLHSAGVPELSQANVLEMRNDRIVNFLGVKVVFGDNMVRLKLQPMWGLQDLKLEIAKRFNIKNINSINLKYLDDDSEWVLLTCDDDLHECVDVHMHSSSNTIRISVHCHEAKWT